MVFSYGGRRVKKEKWFLGKTEIEIVEKIFVEWINTKVVTSKPLNAKVGKGKNRFEYRTISWKILE